MEQHFETYFNKTKKPSTKEKRKHHIFGERTINNENYPFVSITIRMIQKPSMFQNFDYHVTTENLEKLSLKHLQNLKLAVLIKEMEVPFQRNYNKQVTTAWLAQLIERQSTVWEVEGLSPRPDQHSGS